MTADRIADRNWVLTRRRLAQLYAAGFTHRPFVDGYSRRLQYVGPSAPLDALVDETVPAAEAIERMQTFDPHDTSPWVHTLIAVEPDWHIAQDDEANGGRWVVWEDRGHPYDRATAPRWASEELARRYLELLTDNFWTEHPQSMSADEVSPQDGAVDDSVSAADTEFGPCECVCAHCLAGDHCDRASCATPPEVDW